MSPIYSQANPPKSLCLLRLSAIGDVCHAVAVVQQLQKYWPETNITWVIGKTEYALLSGLDNVEFIIFDKKAGLRGFIDCHRILKSRQFDVLLHMQMAFRASLLSLMIRAKHRVGFDRSRAKDLQWLFTNTRIDHTARQHVCDSFMSFCHILGLPHDKPQWQIKIATKDHNFATQLIQQHPTLIITPASSVSMRDWTTENYLAIARYAADVLGYRVLFCGTRNAHEREIKQRLAELAHAQIFDLMGQTDLKQLLALIQQADVLIAPDTGPAHMATMVDTPVISLFASTNPERAAPYRCRELVVSAYPEALQLVYGDKHHQCSWGQRVWDKRAMELVDLRRVQTKLNQVTARKRKETEDLCTGSNAS